MLPIVDEAQSARQMSATYSTPGWAYGASVFAMGLIGSLASTAYTTSGWGYALGFGIGVVFWVLGAVAHRAARANGSLPHAYDHLSR